VNVVVTGVSSFVGCHLARHFAAAGHRVVGTISRPRAFYAGIEAARLAWVEPHVELAPLDLCKPAAFAPLVERTKPRLWIHHAGYATNYTSPDYDVAAAMAVNVIPLDSLYSVLKGADCGVIVTGSSMEYPESSCGNKESDQGSPSTPYGQSKLAATTRAGALAEECNVPTRVARLYIPFGPLDNPAKLVAQALEKLRAGRAVALSPCIQRRDFLGIGEVCEAYEKLAGDFSRTVFDVFNVAGGEGIVIRDFLIMLADRLGAPRGLLRFGELPMRPGEALSSFADINKACLVLSWKPKPLAAALEELIQAS
jgi:nucleoside-diphosphate-sugar epimerase